MKPADGTRLHFIGIEGVLFSETRQEIHAFNTSACVIWCHLEDGLPPSAIAEALMTGSGLDAATAAAHVETALLDWRAKGLLADSPYLPLAMPVPETFYHLPPPPNLFAVEHAARFLGVPVRLRFARDIDAGRVLPLFAHLPRDDTSPAAHVVDVVPVADEIGVWLDAAPSGLSPEAEIACVVKSTVWTAVLRRQAFMLQIHAGVVGGPAGCVLLPAAPGGGKSTLTIALVHQGFDLFSDEVALLAGEHLTVSPFPTAICVKDTGIGIVAGMYPDVAALPIHLRPDGKRVAYLPPPAGSLPEEGHQRAVRGIVFPRYRAGASLTWKELGAAEALARLLGHCQNVGQTLDQAAIARLVRWIEPLSRASVEYDDLDSVRGKIGALLRGDSAGLR